MAAKTSVTITLLAIFLSSVAAGLREKKSFRCSELFNWRNCVFHDNCMLNEKPSRTVMRCYRSKSCRKDISRVYYACGEIHDGVRGQCSDKCRRALTEFWSSKTGVVMTRCSCHGDITCMILKSRYLACFKNETVEKRGSCVATLRLCEENVRCKHAYVSYFEKCQELLFGQYACSPECQAAETRLRRHPIGARLVTCTCDGTVDQEQFCRMARIARRNLCTGNKTR